jgi:glycosyltransferase involved in cell wall biosynthesis
LSWLKETVRPYYLRWIYFPLRPRRRPQAFQDCWSYPFEKLMRRDGDAVRLPESTSNLPDLLFYPMTDWHARIQRTQHLVRAFASLGFRSISINPHLGREFETTPLLDRSHRLSQLEKNIFELHIRLPREPVFHDRLLSVAEDEIIAEAIGRVLPNTPGRLTDDGKRSSAERTRRVPQVIQILSFPLWLGVARKFRDEAGFPIVYDCHDLLSGFQNISGDLLRAETDLLGTADLVLFSSQGLMDRYSAVKRGMLVRNAASAGEFQAGWQAKSGARQGRAGLSTDPQTGAPAPHLVAGYVGALDSWFDVEAIEQSAVLHPQCRFILAGRIEFDPIQRLRALPNVELTGEIPYSRVPELLAGFRIALIPFRINPLTLMTNPIKLYEYFSCGLPVVTTPLPEAQAMGDLVYVGASPADFARQVGRALEEDDPRQRARRREIAVRESWTARAHDISAEFAALTKPGEM